jgi:transcription-repair coupling factor (superfamily II helicase)
MAVRTIVTRFNDEVIEDAIRRELRRGGQCFFVHNRVETIDEIAGYLRRLIPEAKMTVAHGQMPGDKLEAIMLGFIARESDVLVCSSIIESGLDIPNANTILINRADHFGLAQLYQLRGRVGRSDRHAHAYLLLPPEGSMSTDARRRIDAIQDMVELGSGFRLATEDLEIRGAGNVLGAEQSGHIASVGYDLYMEMLEHAMADLHGTEPQSVIEPEIRLPLPALLPDDYVPDVNQRLVIYKQLSSTRNDDELRDVRDDVLDRFGPLPVAAENLMGVIRLKILCKKLGIEALDTAGSELVVRLGELGQIDPKHLVRLLQQPDSCVRVAPDQRIFLRLRRAEDALAESFGLLELLGGAAA